jgi:hypothetical protein
VNAGGFALIDCGPIEPKAGSRTTPLSHHSSCGTFESAWSALRLRTSGQTAFLCLCASASFHAALNQGTLSGNIGDVQPNWDDAVHGSYQARLEIQFQQHQTLEFIGSLRLAISCSRYPLSIDLLDQESRYQYTQEDHLTLARPSIDHLGLSPLTKAGNWLHPHQKPPNLQAQLRQLPPNRA